MGVGSSEDFLQSRLQTRELPCIALVLHVLHTGGELGLEVVLRLLVNEHGAVQRNVA